MRPARFLFLLAGISAAALAACTSTTTIIETAPSSDSDGGPGFVDQSEGGASADDDGGSAGGGGTTKDAGKGGGGGGTSTGSCKYTANATGLQAFQQAGGLAFHTYAPSNYSASVPHTVVVIMHGQDSDGTAELTSLWQSIADTNQLVLLAPKGSLPPTDATTYPNGANWSVNDLNNIQDLVTDIDSCFNVDTKKHILWGFSEGAFYGYLLGIGAATQFSGLAMGGANTSFARENGYPPSAVTWKIPVSHVQGTTDPNGTAQPIQDQKDFEAAGCVFTLYQPNQGHTITQAQVLQQYNDLKASSSP